jgi:hypothetical protein
MSAVPQSGRVYGYVLPNGAGQMILRLTRTGQSPADAIAQLVMRGFLPDGLSVDMPVVSDPLAAKGAVLLGTVAIVQTAAIALSAGIRQVSVTVPASLGLKAEDPVILLPTALLAGYAVHNAIAVSDTRIDVAITAPLLALGAAFSLPCRLYRLNA